MSDRCLELRVVGRAVAVGWDGSCATRRNQATPIRLDKTFNAPLPSEVRGVFRCSKLKPTKKASVLHEPSHLGGERLDVAAVVHKPLLALGYHCARRLRDEQGAGHRLSFVGD